MKNRINWNLISLKLERIFLQQLWIHLLVVSSVALCCWIFNKWIEGITFCIAHLAIRRVFDKQFHLNTTALCMSLTLAIIWFSIPYTLPISVSLLSSIPIAFMICLLGFILQDYVDFKTKAERTIFDLPKDELLAYMDNSTLSDEEKDAIQYHVIDKMKGEVFYRAMGYSKRQSIRIYKSAVNKLNNLIRQ